MSSTTGPISDASTESRVPYDDEGHNGLIFENKRVPGELITEILCYVDCKSLTTVQLVCKRWKMLAERYVWRRKAEMSIGCLLQIHKPLPWYSYYLICKKQPFNKNLLKNTSGEDGAKKHWEFVCPHYILWDIKNLMKVWPPFPEEESDFSGKQYGFALEYHVFVRSQTIDLKSGGLLSTLLNTFEPPIVINDWISCRSKGMVGYKCLVTLLGWKDKVLHSFEDFRQILGDDQKKWHRVSHELTKYGKGVRKIKFVHKAKGLCMDSGSPKNARCKFKMTRTSITLRIPRAPGLAAPENELVGEYVWPLADIK